MTPSPSARPETPLSVKPRKNSEQYLPIIAVCQEEDSVLVESTGSLHSLAELPALLVSHPGAMVVSTNGARLLLYLERQYRDTPRWQYRVAPDRRDVRHTNGRRPGSRVAGTVVHFFGWSPLNKRTRGHYHYPVDPTVFCHQSISELVPGNAPTVVKLIRWGQDVRDWCRTYRLKITPTGGGLAGQLLRDPRWFPEARRKVPRATNDVARVRLPGNHYRLYAEEFTPYNATYLDMRSAHHNIAATLPFPDPNTLMARGHFHVTGDTGVTVPGVTPWVVNGTRAYERVLTMHGLIFAKLTVPPVATAMFPPPYMERPGERMAWVFTNELPLIRALGGVVDWVAAGWLSPHTSSGLNQYARWAMRELDEVTASRKAWLKPSLLATYGILAARPAQMEFGFRTAKRGEPRQYPAGSGMIKAVAVVGQGEREMPTANVVYRGMIEAQQRVESLTMARHLADLGHRVLAVYADSVFIETGGALPLLSHPWQLEQELTELEFLSSSSFTSRQLTRLPGIPREGLTRLRLIEERRHRLEQWRAAGAKLAHWRGATDMPF